VVGRLAGSCQKRILGSYKRIGSPTRVTIYLLIAEQAGSRSRVNGGPERAHLDYGWQLREKRHPVLPRLELRNGSSFLNALVNPFDRLHIVRGENSGYCGSK